MWILIYVLLLVSIQPVAGQGVCRCLDKSGCPNNCNSQCEPGFSGPSCHAANIAVGNTASFSRGTTPLRGTAQQTVDGNTADSNCPSVRGSNPRWEIRFGETRTITRFKIFWSLAELPTGVLAINVGGFTCATRTTAPTEREVSYTCYQPMQGNSVMIILQASTTTLTMCEVEIYECMDGYSGLDCASCNCNGGGNCDKVSGVCDQSAITTTTPTTTTSTTTSTTTTPTTTTSTTTSTTTTPITTTSSTTTTTPTRTTPTTPITTYVASSTTKSSTTMTPDRPSSTPLMDSTTTRASTAKSSTASSDTSTAPTSEDTTATGKSPGTTAVEGPDDEYVFQSPGTLVIVAAVIVCIIGLVLLIVIVIFAFRIKKKREEDAAAKAPDTNGK